LRQRPSENCGIPAEPKSLEVSWTFREFIHQEFLLTNMQSNCILLKLKRGFWRAYSSAGRATGS
jgi:hypothetical protein